MTTHQVSAARSTPSRHRIFPCSFNAQRLALLTCILLLAGTCGALAQKRNITEKDLWDFVWISDPQISPDNSQVAFVRITVNEEKDGYDTSIWAVPLSGGQEPHQLTSGKHDSAPRWSPDGNYCYFCARKRKKASLRNHS